MTREEFYTSDRNEPYHYELADFGRRVTVPLTRQGFEALCQRVTKEHDLILDDGIRSLVAGYIHHIPANEMHFDLADLCSVAYKTLSNNLTYAIDQEVKAKAKAAAAPAGNVLPFKKEDNGPQATS